MEIEDYSFESVLVNRHYSCEADLFFSIQAVNLLSVIIASERNSFDIFSVLIVLYSYRLIFPPKDKLQCLFVFLRNFYIWKL